jgi:membrane protein required for colicin V production
MSIIDIVLIVLLLLGLIRGAMKGLFVEIASLLALLLGVYGALHFSNYAADFLKGKVDWSSQAITVTAFAMTFVITVLAISLAGKALTKLADFAALGILNKLLGAIFGALKIGLVLSFVLIILSKINTALPILTDKQIENSKFYKPVKSLAPSLFPELINGIQPSIEIERAREVGV